MLKIISGPKESNNDSLANIHHIANNSDSDDYFLEEDEEEVFSSLLPESVKLGQEITTKHLHGSEKNAGIDKIFNDVSPEEGGPTYGNMPVPDQMIQSYSEKETLRDVSLTEILAVSKCDSQSTKLTDKLRMLIRKDHEVYKQEKEQELNSSDQTVTSVIHTQSDHVLMKVTLKPNLDQLSDKKQDSSCENGNFQNSPKVRKRQELELSMKELNKLILDENNTPLKRGDPDYESPHNFLVTL